MSDDAFAVPAGSSSPPTDLYRLLPLLGTRAALLGFAGFLTFMAGTIASRAGVPAQGIAVAATVEALLWAPTTLVLCALWLYEPADPRAVVNAFTTRSRRGMRLEVDAYLVEAGLVITHGVVTAAGLAWFADPFLQFLAAALLLTLALAAWILWDARALTHAGLHIAGEEPEAALATIAPVLGRPSLLSDQGHYLAGRAYTLLGRPEDALAAFRRIRLAAWRDMAMAGVAIGQGDSSVARRVLARPTPWALDQRVGRELLFAVTALADRAPQRILDRSDAWSDLRRQLPERSAGMLDLYEAGAAAMIGDLPRARVAAARSGIDWRSRLELRACWPDLWGALSRMEPG